MAFTQYPASLDIGFVQGDDLAVTIDFETELTNYSVSAAIVSTNLGETVFQPAVTIVSAVDGIVSVGLTGQQTASIPKGTYRWSLTWETAGGLQRQALSGFCEVRSPVNNGAS